MLFFASPVKAEPRGEDLITALKDPSHISVLSGLQSFTNPLSRHILEWVYLIKYADQASFEQIETFISQNPDWPRESTLVRKAEEKLDDSYRPYTIKQWFDRHPPGSLHGLVLYTTALKQLGYTQNITAAIQRFWTTERLDRKEFKKAIRLFADNLSDEDHIKRADKLIWDGRYSEAKDLLPYLPDRTKRLFNARIKLATNANGVDSSVSQVFPQDLNDTGFVFERTRWHRRADNDDRALQYLNDKNVAQDKYTSSWWRERHILIRRAIEDGDFQKALNIAKDHRQTSGFSFAQAEFLTGWLYLRYADNANKALEHFTSLYNGVSSPISLSRGAYWVARAYQAMDDPENALGWYTKAAEHPIYFYGQLASSRIGQKPSIPWIQEKPEFSQSPVLDSRWAAIIRILWSWGLGDHTDGFFAKAFAQAKTPADQFALIDLARKTGRYDHVIRASKNIQANTHSIPVESYPTLSYLKPEQAMLPHVLGLIRQESMFYKAAQSHAGAKGLMQLMPATAKETAHHAGLPYNPDRLLTDGDYNTALGLAYLEKLLDKYEGNLILSTAAYNAGPGRVDSWIKTFGDPRNPDIDPIDWIEGLPVYETRNYIQRVLEAGKVYTLLLNQNVILIASNNHKL